MIPDPDYFAVYRTNTRPVPARIKEKSSPARRMAEKRHSLSVEKFV
ncbi:hypothetical protein roselon_00781 [Roseibacterium elongatum DSM 19469]|uniref:Uncharacterized protein n=1 Tax=Roseicyclus elongatus DSM 19469 TaxID=1294273 RepID=W8RZ93_9RHOB|nr:hypothetical protein roselon_00781 [Roseibacterium elongatum DSM 19469]